MKFKRNSVDKYDSCSALNSEVATGQRVVGQMGRVARVIIN